MIVINILSLFSNIGISEALLDKDKFNVVIANEIDEKRVDIYKNIYPETNMIKGDIRKEEIKKNIINKSIEKNVDIIFVTPPCQGMSTAGKMNKLDERNLLICDAIEIVNKVSPNYILIENVPGMLDTIITVDGKDYTIGEYIKTSLEESYSIEYKIINMYDYGVPQSRERVIFLITKKGISRKWEFPSIIKKRSNLNNAIGHLPILDPYIYDIPEKDMLKIFPTYHERKEKALSISKWHKPPKHVRRQVEVMLRTPTGKSAFQNKNSFLPRKKDGTIVKGYKNTYKRQEWHRPAYTITMYNRTISSQNNVHPGREIGRDIKGNKLYSDPRVLTIYEIMLCMSLPHSWDIPNIYGDSFIRSVIGEGLPPKFVELAVNTILT